MEGYTTNMKYELYLLYVKLEEVDVKCPRRAISDDTVRDTISYLNYIFMLMSFISVFFESIPRG